MKKWEYLVVPLPMPAEYAPNEQNVWASALVHELDRLGNDCWKLTNILGGNGIFRRQLGASFRRELRGAE